MTDIPPTFLNDTPFWLGTLDFCLKFLIMYFRSEDLTQSALLRHTLTCLASVRQCRLDYELLYIKQ